MILSSTAGPGSKLNGDSEVFSMPKLVFHFNSGVVNLETQGNSKNKFPPWDMF